MISYKSLTGVPLETIHRCFVDAFSDYQVRMEMPLGKLRRMLERRGFDPMLSVGAFADHTLVGIILNGRREWNGRDTIYDTGTGVVPEYRRQGITSAMFQEVLKLASGLGIRQCLLEVIRTNAPAVELYQKQGFEITRVLECYRAPKEDVLKKGRGAAEGLDITPVGESDWDVLRSFWDFQPSWQNSIASVRAAPTEFETVVAKEEGRVVGYGVIERRSGDVPQLAVAKPFRRRGIGRSILNDLAARCEAPHLAVINVEGGRSEVDAFLTKSGFAPFVGQYEMVLGLNSSQD